MSRNQADVAKSLEVVVHLDAECITYHDVAALTCPGGRCELRPWPG